MAAPARLSRAESQARTRQALLDAAAEVFVERGLHRTSVEAIAERAGFTRGAFYANFADKADALLALLEGPTAIAFLETGGDPVAVAKALGETARTSRVLEIRGGVLEGRPMTADDVEDLAKLPPLEQLRGQVIGAIIAPLNQLIGLVSAPLQNLHGLIDARIEQLGGEAAAARVATAEAPAPTEAHTDEPQPDAQAAREEAQQPETPTADATASVEAAVDSEGSE